MSNQGAKTGFGSGSNTQQSFDVVIAGGGMVGASLALALQRQGKRVACVDPVPLSDDGKGLSPSFDSRATACALTSIWLFENLGLWASLRPYSAPIQHIDVSRKGHWGKVRMAAADIQQAAFGYVVPNSALGAALAQAWARTEQDSDRLMGYWGRKVETAARIGQASIAVTLDNGDNLTTQLLVVADGARSPLREQLGFSASTLQTNQYALVANLAVEQPRFGHAFERFTETGPLALLPLMAEPQQAGEAHYNLVWCGSAADAASRLALSDNEFLAELNRQFGAGLGRITALGKRQSFPVAVTSVDEVAAERVVVLGNAAQALHPVAGQGFNLGLRDIATLVDLLDGATDCGGAEVTNQYAAARKVDRQQMLALTTQLATSTVLPEQGVTAAAFGLGLAGFGQLAGAKHALALRASGLQQSLPGLCQHPSVFQRYQRAG